MSVYNTTGMGAPFGKIVSGKVAVAMAGTAVQVTTSSTPIPGVWICADMGNQDAIVIGDSSVVATQGSQQGIVVIPGNQSFFLPINNLNLLWVDAINSGDQFCYAYLQPYC